MEKWSDNMQKILNVVFRVVVVIFLSVIVSSCLHSSNDDSNVKNNEIKINEGTSLYASVFLTKADNAPVIAECGMVGGVEIKSGFDINDNKTLDANEVDKTYIVCNGADGDDASGNGDSTNIIQETATLEQCPNGGTVLLIGVDIIPLCHASGEPNVTDFQKAKEMITGLKSWLTNTESLSEHAETVARQAELANQMQLEGLDTLLHAVGMLVDSAVEADDRSDGAYAISELIGLPGDYESMTGTITKAGTLLTVSNASFTKKGGEVITTGFDSIILPVNSGNTFLLEVNGLFATSENAEFAAVDSRVNVTSSTVFSDVRQEIDADKAQLDIQIAIGNDTAPVSITTKSAEPIQFKGELEASFILYHISDLPEGISSEPVVNVKLGRVDGTLSQGDTSVTMYAAYEMSNAESFRLVSSIELIQRQSTLVVKDVSTDYGVDEAWRYSYRSSWQIGEIDIVNTGTTFEVYDAYSRLQGSYDSFESAIIEHYRQVFDNNTTLNIEGKLVRRTWDRTGCDVRSYYNCAIEYTYTFDFGSPNAIPRTATTVTYDAQITDGWVNEEKIEQDATRFDNTPLYSITAGIEVEGLVDGDGNALLNAKLILDAARTGYAPEMGILDIGLTVGDQKFVGHFPNRIRSRYGIVDADLFEELSFSFTDMQGGLIRFNESKNQNYWDDEIEADLFYNGNRYGTLYYDKYGDLIIYYSFDKTESFVYATKANP